MPTNPAAPHPAPEGNLQIYGTDDPVAATLLVDLLQSQGVAAFLLTRTDVYFGQWGLGLPGAYQVLVSEGEAEAHRAEIDAALAEVETDLAAPSPPDEDEP